MDWIADLTDGAPKEDVSVLQDGQELVVSKSPAMNVAQLMDNARMELAYALKDGTENTARYVSTSLLNIKSKFVI